MAGMKIQEKFRQMQVSQNLMQQQMKQTQDQMQEQMKNKMMVVRRTGCTLKTAGIFEECATKVNYETNYL